MLYTFEPIESFDQVVDGLQKPLSDLTFGRKKYYLGTILETLLRHVVTILVIFLAVTKIWFIFFPYVLRLFDVYDYAQKRGFVHYPITVRGYGEGLQIRYPFLAVELEKRFLHECEKLKFDSCEKIFEIRILILDGVQFVKIKRLL